MQNSTHFTRKMNGFTGVDMTVHTTIVLYGNLRYFQAKRPHYGGNRMTDVLMIIVAAEWMALGLLFLWKLKDWNKRFQALYDDMKEDVERWKES